MGHEKGMDFDHTMIVFHPPAHESPSFGLEFFNPNLNLKLQIFYFYFFSKFSYMIPSWSYNLIVEVKSL